MDGNEAAQAAQQQARERRRSSISLAIPVCAHQMAASVQIDHDQVEFEAHGVKISQDGLFIDGNNVSSVHQNDLRVLRELGRGACSVVKQAQHVETRQLYAIKVFSVFDRDKRAQLLKEVGTLRGMECPSLINFVGGYLKDGSIHVVLEHMDRGSLSDLIHSGSGMEYGEDLMAAITFQMLWGLGYLHYEHHVHRDVKPQNVLLNSNGEVKLSDFGIARELKGEMDLAQTMVGTIRYMSPERLAGAGYGVAADVWSLGVVLLELASRRLPFENSVSQIELHDRLEQELAVDDLIKLVPGLSPQFEEVLRGCLQCKPEDRLRPDELLELGWFQRFREPFRPATAAAVAVAGEEKAGGTSGGEEAGGGGSGRYRPSENAADGELEGGEEGTRVEEEGEEGLSDLDQAAHAVRDYIAKAMGGGGGGDGGGGASGGGGGGLRVSFDGDGLAARGERSSCESGMIRTMRSDGYISDSDTDSRGEFGSDPNENFGGFAGFDQEAAKAALEQTN
ncbi:unnamed protein product [Pylaiella littoralis]